MWRFSEYSNSTKYMVAENFRQKYKMWVRTILVDGTIFAFKIPYGTITIGYFHRFFVDHTILPMVPWIFVVPSMVPLGTIYLFDQLPNGKWLDLLWYISMVPFVLTIIITKIVTKNITKFSIMVEKWTPLWYYAKFCLHILRKSDFLLFHTRKKP